MHRDIVTHILSTKTDFIITASIDGHVKFWKKIEEGIEFVKHFRSHLGPITDLAANVNGSYMCTASADKSIKIFDIINFDMINMIKLDYVPLCAEWIHSSGDAIFSLAVSDTDSNKIYVYDGQGSSSTPIHIFDKLHSKPVVIMKYNSVFDVTISIDKAGILEYFLGAKNDFIFPSKIVSFESKLDTSMFLLFFHKIVVFYFIEFFFRFIRIC